MKQFNNIYIYIYVYAYYFFPIKSSTSFPHKRNHHEYSSKHSNVANLSDFKLSPEHHKFQQLGLFFVRLRNSQTLSKFAMIMNMDSRRLRLHEYFLTNGDADKQPVHNHRCKTSWTPPNGRNTLIDSFVNYTRDQYNNFISTTPHSVKPNLPKQQQRAVRELSNNTNIVIKEADKGGAITIFYKEDYVHDCNLILTDNSTWLLTFHQFSADMTLLNN